ncbi:YqgE/AlgH family protein [Aridibaculum aurantiacum]|uniref:YqgE/AlgH family protein n=1 Tax=Aridibaculum aurantiacum TaxID=2810307 RepID=UPI001A968F35|nr:YqgE/AlgH family protein [Aridibaculum aurantiacum]
MKLKAGTIIKSTQALEATVFEDAIILVTELNDDGAVGFMLNKPFSRNLNELEEYQHLPPFPLYSGGPVDQEHVFFIHQRPDLVEGGEPVANGLFIGGSFKQVIEGISSRSISTKDIKIFIGYCGWDTGELQAEIDEGSWTVVEDEGFVFDLFT